MIGLAFLAKVIPHCSPMILENTLLCSLDVAIGIAFLVLATSQWRAFVFIASFGLLATGIVFLWRLPEILITI